MKLKHLFENDDIVQQIWNLRYHYPLVSFIHAPDVFIQDLPKNLTNEQLQQLCKLSLSEPVYNHIYRDYSHSRMNVIQSPHRIKDTIAGYLNSIDPKYIELRDMLYTWKRFCDLINDALLDNNDFED